MSNVNGEQELEGPDQKTRERIREAFQSNYRAVLNLLASMTPQERYETLRRESPASYAESEARSILDSTYGVNAVDAALGKVC